MVLENRQKNSVLDLTVDDLYCVKSLNYYRMIFDFEMLREKADELFLKTHNLKTVENFCKSEYEKTKVNPKLLDSEISKRFYNCTFESYKPKTDILKRAKQSAMSYAQNIITNLKEGKNLVLAGYASTGTGKTHLAVAIAKECFKKSVSVKFINSSKMMNQIRQDFKTQRYLNCQLLIIDDITKINVTDWCAEQIYYILNERYSNVMPTIITCEEDIEYLKNYFADIGKAVISRFFQNAVIVPVMGHDYRLVRN